MKTAVTVLQEMMVKLGQTPEYECIAKSGPEHYASFQYRCAALGHVVLASARSKKEAKQEVARVMLAELSEKGVAVPPPYGGTMNFKSTGIPTVGSSAGSSSSTSTVPPRSYVMLLKDLCEQYRLPQVEYELISDTGPPHQRQFAVRAVLGQYERTAVSTTKKAARQLAAGELYTYMRENLARLIEDFVEEEALVRAHDRVMERYLEIPRDDIVWRPDLSQKVADYHTALHTHIDEEKLKAAKSLLEAMECGEETMDSYELLNSTVNALGLTITQNALDRLQVIELTPTSPQLTFAGIHLESAVAVALDYLRLTICET